MRTCWVELHSKSLQYREYFLKVSNVMLGNPNFDQHVIDIHLYISINLLLEDLIDEPLIGRTYIF